MDLSSATYVAREQGAHVRDDATMREGWTVRWVPEEKLLYYFNPQNERKHKVQISDAQRASYQWRIMPC